MGTNGSITTRKTVRSYQGTPKPEADLSENRTVSHRLPHEAYSFGLAVPGSCMMSAGAQNNNSLLIAINGGVGIVTSTSHTAFTAKQNITVISVSLIFMIRYVPNKTTWKDGASITGSYTLSSEVGHPHGKISSISNTTISRLWL